MPYAERDGLKLYYERDGSGRELVFVPGWCCDHTFYTRRSSSLALACRYIRALL
jgi:hypothetical protein